ncbi:MAG: CotH kinase family protein [Candidatus Hermodarchaeota archaeon]
MPSKESFKNRRPVHQKKKEFIIIFTISMLIISTIYFYTYLLNSPYLNPKNPRININFEDNPSYDEYINCTFELVSDNPSDNVLPLDSKLKIRGSGTNWNEKAPKKGYRIQLSERISLLGMRSDDDWLLMEMYYDSPRMRIKLCFDVWRSLEETDPSAILPNSKYVSLFINNEFQGLFLLAEKIDRRLFDLDNSQENKYSSLLFQATGYNELREYDKNQWDQDWPNQDDNNQIMDEILADLIDFINNSEDNLFFDPNYGIYTKFEKQNLIDFYIYNFFILHLDFWHGNYFIVRNSAPGKFYLIPWDFDFSFGQFGGSESHAQTNPENEIKRVNELYKRLLNSEDFINDCKIRWTYLRENLWIDDDLMDMLSDIYKEIKDQMEFEANQWDPIFIKKGWDISIQESITNLFNWIPERLEFCDYYFEFLIGLS